MDRESSELSKQFTMEIDNHLRVDWLPFVVREGHIEAARGQSH
jgi:hypothetical protein